MSKRRRRGLELLQQVAQLPIQADREGAQELSGVAASMLCDHLEVTNPLLREAAGSLAKAAGARIFERGAEAWSNQSPTVRGTLAWILHKKISGG